MGNSNFVRNHAFSRVDYYSMLAMTANACELEAGKGAEVLAPWPARKDERGTWNVEG